MAQQIFIVYTDDTKIIADSISENIFVNGKIKVDSLSISADDIMKMASKCFTEFFYVIFPYVEYKFIDFDFSFKPSEWDKKYLHVWNNLAVRLYNKKRVLENPYMYSDDELSKGNIELKIHNNRIFEYKPLDIIFLSYDEIQADENFRKLQERFPYAKRVHGVKGIFEAHKKAAEYATSNMFYVVDADSIIKYNFNFDYYPSLYNIDTVHVWSSENPVNDLVYGYGGVKLFPKNALLNYTGSPTDFTTSVSKNFKIMDEVSNITNFNTDPFSAWRSGFRECTKLSSKIIQNQNSAETEHRLSVWCSKGAERCFGEFAIAGARAGAEYGKTYSQEPEMLNLINNYDWLMNRFNKLTVSA